MSASDRAVTLVQLVQKKDGSVTGRLEEVTVAANGTVRDQSMPVDGAASKHDLMVKPANAWLGGLTASGSFTANGLTLTGENFTLNAERSDLDKYRASVAHLQSVAADDRQRIATARAAQEAQVVQAAQLARAQADQARSIRDAADKAAKIEAATAQLRKNTSKMNVAAVNCPEFGRRAAMNTEKVARMLRKAPSLSDWDRSQLAFAANQVEFATNQIEFAQSRYADGLNQIIQDSDQLAGDLERFCGSPQAAQFAQPCIGAKAAAAEYRAAFAHDRATFVGFKQSVQVELTRQAAMIKQMGG